jgi:hypothetical protein
MTSWLAWLWDFIKNPENRTVIAWLCGGLVVTAGGIWKVVTFFAERKKADEKNGGGTNVTVGQGFGTVRDQTFEAPVNFGPSPEHIKQIQEPFERQLAAQNALTDNLTKALLERSPVAAGPGAQQAVGAAVKSIAEGAEAGDNRLENALSLLKENKTAEAAQLLTGVAEDKKTARIEQDRKEAAIAYRNLGAIAGLRDPKAAREAYARAMALDPDNAEGLFWDRLFCRRAMNGIVWPEGHLD